MEPERKPLPEKPDLPITDLSKFMEEIRKLFDNIVYHWDQLLFEEEFRLTSQLTAAWEELRPKIKYWKDALYFSRYENDLQTAGLQGPQLDLKLQGLSSAWSRFKSRGTARLLRNLLGWVNAILGSLAKVIPGVEALKELKEAIERLITADET